MASVPYSWPNIHATVRLGQIAHIGDGNKFSHIAIYNDLYTFLFPQIDK
jgi:hypothetical protein